MRFVNIVKGSVWLAFLLSGNMVCSQNRAPLPLQNGGFEEGTKGWAIREKVPMSVPNAEAAQEGKMGLRVSDDDATAGSNALSERVSIVGGRGYHLSFWAKTMANDAAVLQFRFYDADRKGLTGESGKLPVSTTNGRWLEMNLTDRAPQNAAFLSVWIHSYTGAKATLDFDNFMLHETAADNMTRLPETTPGKAEDTTKAADTPKTADAPNAVAAQKSTNAARLRPPYIIIKADDLRQVNGRAHARWKKFADFIKARKIKASIGIIGNSLEGNNPDYINWIKDQQATGLFEFWNHGYVHEPWQENGQKVQEFKGTSYETQKQHFQKTQTLAREKLGVPFTTFGAPGNAADDNTAKVLNEVPEIKVWLYGNDKNPSGKIVLDRVYPVNIENPLFLPSLDKFVEGYNKYPKREYFVIQGHAAKWDEARFEQFTKIVDFLIAQNAIFITPSEYAQIKAKAAP
jgi:peptidoglycan/xylan/chitin deacetylase (PgdA/CDA1 family)